MDELKIQVAEALTLKPGDQVLLLFKDNHGLTKQTADFIKGTLEERFPDVTFALITGVDIVAVNRNEG